MKHDEVVEATFMIVGKELPPPVEYAEPPPVTPVSPEFPPCPQCGVTRYWISRGMVMCGSRTCRSAVRFVLTKIEYYRVHPDRP